MNKMSLVLAALLSVAAGSALADSQDDFNLQNRTPFTGTLSRAEVQQDLAAAQRSGELASIGAEAGYGPTAKPVVSARSRAEVQAEAVAAAHAPNQNVDPRSFVNSRLPATLTGVNAPQQASAGARQPL